MIASEDIGEQLRRWRESRNIPQAAIAHHVGCDQKTVSHIEHGKSVTIENVNGYLDALGRSWSELVFKVEKGGIQHPVYEVLEIVKRLDLRLDPWSDIRERASAYGFNETGE